MIDPRWDEQAALAALGWADDPAALDRASTQDMEIAETMRDYAEVVALLSGDAPQHAPPAALRRRILENLDGPLPVLAGQGARVFQFRRVLPYVLPYVLAVCLMGLVLFQTVLILNLHRRLNAAHAVAMAATVHHDMPPAMELADLAPQGDHGKAKVMVAWDPQRCCGMVTMDDMPPPPPGHDYQLWVLDPSKKTPVNAGVVARGVKSQHFIAGEVRMNGRPGFAVSLEPAGGMPTPTGTILFAVAPSL
jgi:anti-sigma-K factor RskA